MRVAWFSLEALGGLVRRHRVDDSVGRAMAGILRAHLVVVDDVGMLPVGPDAAEGFYRLMGAAYERRSVAVGSNLDPAGWDELMPKTLATATVDRAPAPRPRRHDRRGELPPGGGHLGEGGGAPGLTSPEEPVAAGGEPSWPPAGRFRGRGWGGSVGR